MNRAELHFLIETSLSANRPDYAGALAQAWLAQWPGDIGARFQLARARMFEERPKEAVAALESATHADLEHAAAHRLLGQLQSSPVAYATAHALNGSPLPPNMRSEPPAWLSAARRAVTALSAGQYHSARQFAEMTLRHGDAPPLASLVLLKAHWQAGQTDLALPLAEGFHERWPRGVAFILCLAEGLFRLGDSHRAVELLHTASALDPAGEVVGRYWGASHPYTDLWPQPITVPLPGPIPAEVGALLGSNRLASPPQSAWKSTLNAPAGRVTEKGNRVHASRRSHLP
ncbi:MAG: tetratricopeptide repeat protein, partial [Chloroflexota bacterium]